MVIDRLKGNSVTNRLMGCSGFGNSYKDVEQVRGEKGKDPRPHLVQTFPAMVFTLEYKGVLSVWREWEEKQKSGSTSNRLG